ncbi:MAG TPA: transcriptional regulator MraZ [Planctomycetota bacterium]|nr:transcriptional regulator MraZ [Planctomycetota bacterium]
MLHGSYTHALDAKGRVAVPRPLLDEMRGRKREAPELALTPGTDGCLFLFASRDLDSVLENVIASPFAPAEAAHFQRMFFSKLFRCAPDGQGRILVPPPLQRFAGLARDVVFVGVRNRVEVWASERWAALEAKAGSQFDTLARKSYGSPLGREGGGSR